MAEEKMIKIGKVKLTQQAFGVFVIGTIMSLVALLTLRNTKGVGFALGMFAFTCYNTYVNNCLVVGDCKILAWVLLALTALSALAVPMRLKSLGSSR